MAWLEGDRGQYDVIFCDPPTFSNSARADDFDVQREQLKLLRAAVARLAPGGVLYSNNFRRFKLEENAIAEFAQCREITARTIGPDFERNARIHRAWELKRLGKPGSALPLAGNCVRTVEGPRDAGQHRHYPIWPVDPRHAWIGLKHQQSPRRMGQGHDPVRTAQAQAPSVPAGRDAFPAGVAGRRTSPHRAPPGAGHAHRSAVPADPVPKARASTCG